MINFAPFPKSDSLKYAINRYNKSLTTHSPNKSHNAPLNDAAGTDRVMALEPYHVFPTFSGSASSLSPRHKGGKIYCVLPSPLK